MNFPQSLLQTFVWFICALFYDAVSICYYTADVAT